MRLPFPHILNSLKFSNNDIEMLQLPNRLGGSTATSASFSSSKDPLMPFIRPKVVHEWNIQLSLTRKNGFRNSLYILCKCYTRTKDKMKIYSTRVSLPLIRQNWEWMWCIMMRSILKKKELHLVIYHLACTVHDKLLLPFRCHHYYY